MRGNTRHVAAFAILFASACGTGDTNVDPGDLELRDLLGVSPDVATTWNTEQRSSARHVFVDALGDERTESISIGSYNSDDQLVHALALVDAKRLDAGQDALALVRITGVQLTKRPATIDGDLVDALARANSHESGDLVVTREPRLTVAAAFVEGEPARLLVNPIMMAAFDDGTVALDSPRRGSVGGTGDDLAKSSTKPKTIAANGNPYSFYGSIAECAYAQRLRCEACLPSSSCNEAITQSTGMEECTKLAENDGRGYFLLCINLSLAINSVEQCTSDSVGSCPQVTTAANDLSQLEANATFVSDMACASGLDGCLAKIYGSSNGSFPSLIDGGVSPPPTNPPRDVDVSCGDGCSSDNNSNCEASPNCDCSGPSCNNSLSCDSTCASSNDQSGCGGGCDSCESEGGGNSSSGGGCGGSSSSGGSSGGCGSCESSSGGSSGGGGCSGGGCGGDSGGGCGGGGGGCGDSGGGGSCGGGGGGGCQVTKKEPSAVFAVGFSLVWAFLPIPVAAMIRRRSRKQKRTADTEDDTTDEAESTKEVQS
ncbi:MAG TPA: hypothetical protein VL326_01035 [Kofleriaceae bacterium]|nr:hypothetical protein [Kofleriaceae bacterium]